MCNDGPASADRLIGRSARNATVDHSPCTDKENIMGKYFLAWLCGVPAFLLVLIYFFVH